MKHCVRCGHDFDTPEWTCPGCGFAPEMVRGVPSFVDPSLRHGPAEFDRSVYERMMANEERSFYYQTRRKILAWAFFRFFPEAHRILEMGTGTGIILSALLEQRPDLEAWGSDLELDSLDLTRARTGGKARMFHTDAAHIPFRDHFDAIGAFDVIEHIEDDTAALRDMHAALRRGGGILVSVPQHMSLWSRLDRETGHKRRYVGTELADKVRAAGFDVRFDSSFMATLFPAQYVSRRLLTPKDERARFDDEHSLPGPINSLLAGLLEMEMALIRTGLQLPFGGMRFIAGRKR